MRSYFAAAALLLACVAAQDTSHDSHDHDSHEDEATSHASHDSHEAGEQHFEAAAVYDVNAGTNSFVVVPAEGSFEDETFAFMIVPAATADADGLEAAEEDAELGQCTSLPPQITSTHPGTPNNLAACCPPSNMIYHRCAPSVCARAPTPDLYRRRPCDRCFSSSVVGRQLFSPPASLSAVYLFISPPNRLPLAIKCVLTCSR